MLAKPVEILSTHEHRAGRDVVEHLFLPISMTLSLVFDVVIASPKRRIGSVIKGLEATTDNQSLTGLKNVERTILFTIGLPEEGEWKATSDTLDFIRNYGGPVAVFGEHELPRTLAGFAKFVRGHD